MTDSLTIPAVARQESAEYAPLDLRAVCRWLAAHDGQAIAVTLSRKKVTRTNRQNRTYWGLVIAAISEHTGHTAEEIHEILKSMFLPRKYITLAGLEREIGKTTTELSTAEFAKYLDRVYAFAAQELGLVIPLPGDE